MRTGEQVALVALVVAGLLACGEPSPYVDTRIHLPAGVAPDAKKLHLEQDVSGSPTAVPHYSHAEPTSTEPLPDGFDVELSTGVGPERFMFLHVWYDTNGNGAVDSGDATGDLSPAPFAAHDGGGCNRSSNKNRSPDLVLAQVP